VEAEQFGRYILLRRIAEGGMGEVFLAQQPGIAGFAKQLVVKRIRPAVADNPQFIEAFINEGRVAALIDHPNVVHIHELGEIDGRYFIAMEYVHGRSLADVLDRLGDALELSTALYIMNNVCEGLAFAHEANGLDGEPLNLVHRDVSPPNILIGYSGGVKVLDFGIAKVQHHSQTAAGEVKGKFAYLSPEQARGEPVDRRSDIYALGLVLYEITVGRQANPGANEMGMAFAATQGDLPDPTEVIPGYPPALARIFARATALDPADRHEEVKELQDDLLAFQAEEGLITSASRVGGWLRELFPDDEPEGELALSLDSAPDAEPPRALAPTIRAMTTPTGALARETGEERGEPGILEVDLEKERGETLTRRRSPAPLLVVAGLVSLLLVAGGLLLCSRDGGDSTAGIEQHEGGAGARADGGEGASMSKRTDSAPDKARATPKPDPDVGAPDAAPPAKAKKVRRRRRPRRRTRRRRVRRRPAPVPTPPPPKTKLPDDVVPGPPPLAEPLDD
jgi:serine/threonine protein kinase